MDRLVLFAAVFAVALLLLGCAGNAPEGQKSPSAANPASSSPAGSQASPQKISPDSINDPDLRSIYEASLEQPPPKTSIAKLAEAFDSGKIPQADYAVFSMQAIYTPQSLPSQYSGAALEGYDDSRDTMLLLDSWDMLTTQQKEQMAPLIRLGNGDIPKVAKEYAEEIDIESVSIAPGEADPSPAPLMLSPQKITFAGPVWIEYKRDVAGGKFSLRERLPVGHSQAEYQAMNARFDLLEKATTETYPKFKQLWGIEPTQQVWVYAEELPKGVLGRSTLAEFTYDPVERCRLFVDFNQTGLGNEAKATLAHELFHCFQFIVPMRNFNDTGMYWLAESTAVWSEHYAYPDYNTEQPRLPRFFKTREEMLFQKGLKAYADYPFWLMLQQKGAEASTIDVLKAAKSKTAEKALSEMGNYDNFFADFAVWSWNQDPVNNYQDSPNFPALKVTGPAVSYNLLFEDSQADIPYVLQPGAAHYSALDMPQEAKKIKFTFPQSSDPKRQRTALIKINGIRHDEDWGELSEKTFCPDQPGEKVQAAVIVLSNSDLDHDFSSTYSVDTTGECPRQIGGTTKITWDFTMQGKTTKSIFTSHDTLQYDSEEDEYVLKTRRMTCSYSDTVNIEDELMPVHSSNTGSGSSTEEYPNPYEAPLKIRFDYNDNEVDFKVDPDTKNPNWVHYTGKLNGIPTDEYGDCITFSPVPSLIELPMGEYLTGDRLHGTKNLITSGVSSTLEFDYIIPEPEIKPEEE
jgi:hypothetical protein